MALINCSECGKPISEKAKKCVHCGKVFEEGVPVHGEKHCNECAHILSDNDTLCPNCGCPVVDTKSQEAEAIPQLVEVAGIKVNKKFRTIAFCSVIAVLVCVVSIFGIYTLNQAKEKQEYQASFNEYIDNLEQAQSLMIESGSKAEILCNLTLKVWGDAIRKERNIETYKFTQPKGVWVKDFNEALGNLFSASDTKEAITGIADDQSAVKELIKKMQVPPEGLDKCYDTVTSLYASYITLTELAVNPSSNLTGYSSNKSTAVAAFLSAYKQLGTQIPEKIIAK